ncbi:riboflavin kinase/FMN adenylyltransferase [Hydrogenivirga caldilitoris]|uniref:Riboflavin biosynthesis protein n=1 Tax=Hydrogenivirga caldilitoris TaxID=246264 RepID=A0A497XQF7_9AQUI|nr:bifunctional riboflavin kinase/FAD synthetase [Hydrogenivirga caldilitoris]RLJ71217.1 riboflavin kinase/FMN adenylyltransferase [Hydrogenivirga caldilitoris]
MKPFFLKLSEQRCPIGVDLLERVSEDTALIVGNFDGLHLGHKYLIDTLKRRAHEKGLKSMVVTFCPHPLKVLAPRLFLCELSTAEEKMELLKEEGIDYLCFIRFDEDFSRMSAKDFLEEVIYRRLGCKYLLVGYDWRFGYRREGEIELAKEVGERLGFEVELAKPFKKNGHIVSSTLVRRLLSEGRLEEAAQFLGRRYWIRREVIKGDGRGSRIGFPTANLKDTEELCLKEGVYAVLVDDGLPGVANFGFRPTFEGSKRVLEVHIPNFSGDLRGKSIKVEFIRFLREERKFPSVEELKSQIEKDVQLALAVVSPAS